MTESIAVKAESTDKARLEELYRLYGGEVARWSVKLGGPRADVDDLVQEVFLVIASKFKGFRGEAKLTTWLFRITQNVVCNRRRREQHWGWVKVVAKEAARNLPVAADDAGEPMQRREAKARIYRVLDHLSEAHRTILILFEMEELSGEQIAELTGIRTEAVWMRLTRARREFAMHFARTEGKR